MARDPAPAHHMEDAVCEIGRRMYHRTRIQFRPSASPEPDNRKHRQSGSEAVRHVLREQHRYVGKNWNFSVRPRISYFSQPYAAIMM